MSSGGFCHVYCVWVHGRHWRGGGAARQKKKKWIALKMFFDCSPCVSCPSVASCYWVCVGNWCGPKHWGVQLRVATDSQRKTIHRGRYSRLFKARVSTLMPPRSFLDSFFKDSIDAKQLENNKTALSFCKVRKKAKLVYQDWCHFGWTWDQFWIEIISVLTVHSSR